ncbi:MAG TPA: DUF4349 domain-containing protein [Solirubrobacterales bacterium]|jgi:Domain of unknown function (DUF4349)|nr:DUF4349 domain-containing protein [Solirubrobacterales bacterium]
MTLEELERELRADRPQVDPDFARKLDDWAAAGFSRGGQLGPQHAPRAQRRWTFQPTRWLAPAGGLAALIALVVGVSSLQNGNQDDAGGGGGRGGEALAIEDEAAPASPPAESVPEAADSAGGPATAESLSHDARRVTGGAATGSGIPHGKQAQNVDLALATAPEDFRDTADGVLDVVDDHSGFVLRSSVSGGDPSVEGARQGRANFEIRVPAGQLQPAIAALSDLGHVVSRTDGTKDITSRFNDAKRRIATYTQARDRLLRRLEDATTETEQDAIRAQLRIVEAQLAEAQDDLGNAQQRVQLVPVSVTVSSDSSVSGSDGDWGLGDALDDAGRVLTVAGGVLLISAAVLLPLALLAAVAWLIADRARHRARERTLDA